MTVWGLNRNPATNSEKRAALAHRDCGVIGPSCELLGLRPVIAQLKAGLRPLAGKKYSGSWSDYWLASRRRSLAKVNLILVVMLAAILSELFVYALLWQR